MEDPRTFSKPWKISMPLYRRREPNVQLMEYKCVEFTEELLYGLSPEEIDPYFRLALASPSNSARGASWSRPTRPAAMLAFA